MPKLLDSVDLLLKYANGWVSLPRAVADPERDFLGVLLGVTLGLCVLAFASGWLVARLLRTDALPRDLLMFGLGMNNNGTGLVLALADHPRVLLASISCNLMQHLVGSAWTSC